MISTNINLLLKMAGDGIAEAQAWLTDFFKTAEGDFFACTPEEAAKPSCTVLPRREPLSVTRQYI